MSKRSNRAASKPEDAITLLKADHSQVKAWLEEFTKIRGIAKKQQLAADICMALSVHMQIEEEIFYPAFIKATKDKDIHHEAIIEHDAAKKLIAEIDASSPVDDYFDSMLRVLSETIHHHVNEEEQPDGMFAESENSEKMDLVALGEQLAARKLELYALHEKQASYCNTSFRLRRFREIETMLH